MREANTVAENIVVSNDMVVTSSITDSDTHELPHDADAGDVAADKEERLVPVSEAIRYRKRAQAAEKLVGQLREDLTKLENDLNESQETADYLERQQRISELLAEEDVVDLGAARLLTEVAIAEMEKPDVRMAVEDLRKSKPYLFRRRSGRASHMPARDGVDESGGAASAAEIAAGSGSRSDLLRYLRLRRERG